MSGRPTRLVLDGELLSTPPRCLTLEFYGRYSRTIYVTHPVPPLDVNQEMRPTIRKLPGVKRKYFRWYIEDMRKRKEQARILSNYIEDIGFARAWFLLVRELPLEVPHPHFTEHDPITKKVCEECSEWIAATERVAVMMCRAEKYGIQEYKRAFAIAECQKYSKRLEMKPNADIDISNLLRTQIRHHILERNGLLFAWRTAAFEGPITTAELRPNLFSQIESFYDELDQMLFPLLSSSEHKQRQIQIALQQECTKIAFNAIRLYMDTIEKEVELIKVECDIVGNKLVMPVDRIADDLKAPIIEACNSDRIILTSDTVDDILDECVKFVEKYLNIDEISRLDLVKQFNRLVFHSKLTPVMHDAQLLDFVRISRDYLFRLQRVPKTINRALFVVDMTKVWNVLRRRASEIIAESTERICDNFASKLREIHGDLEQFGRSINFRSMDPVAMLSNKAQVMKMTSDFLPKLIMNLLRAIDKMFLYSQVIMFESCDYELMTTVAALRMAIPKQVAEHSAFFDRRIHIFKQFVRTRQTVVVKTISETAEKLKRVLVFYDPKSVDSYLREMRKLQPELQEVARLVHTLNEFEEVLGMTKTDGEEICIQAENLIQIEVLFDWTNRFYVFQRKFMESSRLGAKTVDGKTFLGDFEAVLKISSERIEALKSIRHFIVQISMEVESLKEKFEIIDVLGNESIMERHWKRMGDVCGIDMSQYSSSTAFQICELRLERFLPQLKQIVYAAEREAGILDQIQQIYAFWEDATFSMKISNQLWSISFPTNLDSLTRKARNHGEQMVGFDEHVDTMMGDVREKMRRWTEILEKLHNLLSDWSNLLHQWFRFASLMLEVGHEKILTAEFEFFRKCAKYFRMFDNFIQNRPIVVHILEEKKAAGWLRSVNRCLQSMIEGIAGHFQRVKRRNARLCLLSDSDLLKILSKSNLEKRLEVIQRECFPYARLMRISPNQCLGVVAFDGEQIELTDVKKEVLEKGDIVEVLELIEKAVDAHFNQDLEELLESQDLTKLASKFMQNLFELCSSSIAETPLVYKQKDKHVYFSLKTAATPIPLLLDFSLSTSLRTIIPVFAKKWALGLVPITQGSIMDSRYLVKQLNLVLFCSVHFVSCHELLKKEVMDIIVEAVHQNSVLFVMENIDQLTLDTREFLFEKLLSRRLPPFPRLVLHTLNRDLLGSAVEDATFLAESLIGSESEKSGNRITISPSGLDVSTSSGPGTRRNSIRRRRSSIKQKSFAESLLQMFIEGIRSSPCAACVGSIAKVTLGEALSNSNAVLTWIYFDSFTQDQIVASNVEFAADTGGFLLRNLKDSMKRDAESLRGELSPVPSESSEGRCVSIGSKPTRYVIFYGRRKFFQHFSFIGSLFSTESSDSIPYAFITLPDGSNFYAASNVRFILCVPESDGLITNWLSRFDIQTIVMDQRVEQSVFEVWSEFKTDLRTYLKDPDYEKAVVDCFEKILLSLYDSVPKKTFAGTHQFFELCKESMLEALPYAFPTNCFELFRSKLCSTAVNWLVLFAEVPDSFIDKQMNELVLAADSGLTFSAKIPNKVTEWKLSKMDFGRWVRWIDESTISSNTKKDASLNQVFISYTAVDRVISYALSHFLERKKDLVITGPPLSGKSTILREIVNYIVSTDETYEFHFFSIFDRSNLEVMQKKFYRVMRSLNPKKQSVLVIDSVRFVNALTPLLEMFLDQNLVMEKGVPVKWKTSIQLILVLDEVEFEICNKQELFTSKIVVVPVKATTEADAKFVLEQLFEWNLTVKTFSSEYQSILAPMAAASVSMIRFLKMELWLTMVHLAKGFMFAFPVNVPDVISMVRLWCHEAIRVMTDPLRSKPKKEALEFLKNELFKMNMTISALFEPLNGQRHYVDTEEHGDLRKINDAALNQVDRLNSLLFSELMTADAIDGLGYNVVPNRASLNRLVENIIYESSRGRSNVKIDIAITDYVSEHCQRLMRICRQSSEHAALVGSRGVSRSGCVQVASYGIFGQLLFAHWDLSTVETAESSWKMSIVEGIQLVARSNHPIMVVVKLDSKVDRGENLTNCIRTLREWLQKPIIDELVSDHTILSLGESILEHEKLLTSAMQSSGIRLPGQRMSYLLPLDALKEVNVLRETLSARMSDLLHFVFIVDPGLEKLFKWCSVDYYQPIDASKLDEMLTKIMAEVELEKPERIASVLREMHSRALKVLRGSKPVSISANQLYTIFNHFASLFNRKKTFLEKRRHLLCTSCQTLALIETHGLQGGSLTTQELIKQLDDDELNVLMMKRDLNITNAHLQDFEMKIEIEESSLAELELEYKQNQKKVDGALRQPTRAFTMASEAIENLSAAQYKRLAALAKPSLAAKYSVEAVRVLTQPSFVPKRNTLETWAQSLALLRSYGLHELLIGFNINTVSADMIKKLKRYTDNRDFRIPKLESEAPVAARLCQWVFAVIDLITARASTKVEADTLQELQKLIGEKSINFDILKHEQQKALAVKEELEDLIERMNERVANTRRIVDYRNRSGRITEALNCNVIERWRKEENKSNEQLESLVGNCALMALTQVMCLSEKIDVSLRIELECKKVLQNKEIFFEHHVAKRHFYLLEYFRSVTLHSRWPLVIMQNENLSLSGVVNALFGNTTTISWKYVNRNKAITIALKSGGTLVVKDFDGVVPRELLPMIGREVAFENDQSLMVNPFGTKTLVHDEFRVFFETRLNLEEIPVKVADEMQVVMVTSSDDISKEHQNKAFIDEHERSENVFLFKTLSECGATEILDSSEISEQICIHANLLASSL